MPEAAPAVSFETDEELERAGAPSEVSGVTEDGRTSLSMEEAVAVGGAVWVTLLVETEVSVKGQRVCDGQVSKFPSWFPAEGCRVRNLTVEACTMAVTRLVL